MKDPLAEHECEQDLLDKAEAAQYLKTTERHMESLAKARKIGHSKVGRFLRFTKSDLDLYLTSTHQDPSEGA